MTLLVTGLKLEGFGLGLLGMYGMMWVCGGVIKKGALVGELIRWISD